MMFKLLQCVFLVCVCTFLRHTWQVCFWAKQCAVAVIRKANEPCLTLHPCRLRSRPVSSEIKATEFKSREIQRPSFVCFLHSSCTEKVFFKAL